MLFNKFYPSKRESAQYQPRKVLQAKFLKFEAFWKFYRINFGNFISIVCLSLNYFDYSPKYQTKSQPNQGTLSYLNVDYNG